MTDGGWLAPLAAGFGLGGSLIVAIGAQNAFVLRQGLARRHVGAVVLVCAVADALLMTAGVLGVGAALRSLPALATALTVGGVLFLAGYGVRALWRALHPSGLEAGQADRDAPLGPVLAQAVAFTLLNPHVYLDTVLLVGTLGAQYGVAAERMAFLAGACAASAVWFTLLGYGARALAPWFARPSAWRVLDALVGLTMLALAASLLGPLLR